MTSEEKTFLIIVAYFMSVMLRIVLYTVLYNEFNLKEVIKEYKENGHMAIGYILIHLLIIDILLVWFACRKKVRTGKWVN